MNLKTAARRLDVHYQTVYRWVRSGELPAIRRGASYEVTDEAVEYFLARREAMTPTAAVPLAAHVAGSSMARTDGDVGSSTALVDGRASLLADARALLHDCAATATPIMTRIVQGVAEVTGSLCSVRLLDNLASSAMRLVTWWHPQTSELAAWSQIASSTTFRADHPMVARVLAGELLVIDHMLPRDVRAAVGPDAHFMLDKVYPHTLMAAPIMTAQGRTRGALIVVRGEAGRLFSHNEQALAVTTARMIAGAITRAESFATTKAMVHALHDELSAMLVRERDLDAANARAAGIVNQSAVPAYLLDRQARFMATSTAFRDTVGIGAGAAHSSLLTISRDDDAARDRAVLERLWRGEIDHVSINRERLTVNGPALLDAHWSAVRWPDARPAFVVATQSPALVA